MNFKIVFSFLHYLPDSIEETETTTMVNVEETTTPGEEFNFGDFFSGVFSGLGTNETSGDKTPFDEIFSGNYCKIAGSTTNSCFG